MMANVYGWKAIYSNSENCEKHESGKMWFVCTVGAKHKTVSSSRNDRIRMKTPALFAAGPQACPDKSDTAGMSHQAPH